jgi:polyisoprenoid-binding protein YceI
MTYHRLTTALVMTGALIAGLTLVTTTPAVAAPVTYKIDPEHTYPSFEADHLAGLSVWRGKITKSAGTVTLDKDGGSGEVDVAIELGSIAFGQKQLERWAVGPQFLDAKKHPQARFRGRLDRFVNGAPTQVVGALTMRGVTRPLTLKLNSFKCMQHPIFKRELCGADALGSFKRDEFGLDAGKDYGFSMDVLLRIQVEALANAS